MPNFDINEEFISRRLAETHHPQHQADNLFRELFGEPPRPAAVLVPFFYSSSEGEADQAWHVLFTRRTELVAEHQGQVAFPGGRADITDISPEMTALREAREEIGLDPTRVTILGKMDSMVTITNYLVTPVVAVIPWPFPIQLEPTEVSRVFSIPLDWLADPKNHELRQREFPNPVAKLLHRQSIPVVYYQPYAGELLWGVSAEITRRLMDILINKKKAGD